MLLCALCLINTSQCYCQTLNTPQRIAAADSAYAKRQYFEAAVAYDKLAYFEIDSLLQLTYYFKKVNALKQAHLFTDACRTLTKINRSLYTDSTVTHIRYQLALCYYLDNNLTQAESQLIQLQLIPNATIKHNVIVLYALVLNEQLQWQAAQDKLISYTQLTITDTLLQRKQIALVKTMYVQPPKLKHTSVAKNLSTVIPGAGQAYAGAGGEALAASSLSLTTLVLAGVGVYNQYYITSFVIGYMTFQRFYMANINRAMFLTEKRNYKRAKVYNEQLRSALVQLTFIN